MNVIFLIYGCTRKRATRTNVGRFVCFVVDAVKVKVSHSVWFYFYSLIVCVSVDCVVLNGDVDGSVIVLRLRQASISLFFKRNIGLSTFYHFMLPSPLKLLYYIIA